MSDFGAVYEYALQLEASIPAGMTAEMEAIRPAVMGMTKRQTEEAEKLAAMAPEERAAAEAKIAVTREENRAKAEEAARKRAADAAAAANRPAPHPTATLTHDPAHPASPPHAAPAAHPAPAPHEPAANNKK